MSKTKLNELYATSDGYTFYTLHDAEAHAKSLKNRKVEVVKQQPENETEAGNSEKNTESGDSNVDKESENAAKAEADLMAKNANKKVKNK